MTGLHFHHLLLALALALALLSPPSSQAQSIGVLGGGVAGVSFSRFLSDLAPASSSLDVTISEATSFWEAASSLSEFRPERRIQ
jgi:hypothetical protein